MNQSLLIWQLSTEASLFDDDKTAKATMGLQIVSAPIVNTVGEDTDDLGGELLMDTDFYQN